MHGQHPEYIQNDPIHTEQVPGHYEATLDGQAEQEAAMAHLDNTLAEQPNGERLRKLMEGNLQIMRTQTEVGRQGHEGDSSLYVKAGYNMNTIDTSGMSGEEYDRSHRESTTHEYFSEKPDGKNVMVSGLLEATGAKVLREDVAEDKGTGSRIYQGALDGEPVYLKERIIARRIIEGGQEKTVYAKQLSALTETTAKRSIAEAEARDKAEESTAADIAAHDARHKVEVAHGITEPVTPEGVQPERKPDGYTYPRDNEMHRDYSNVPSAEVKVKLDEAYRGSDGIYRKPGFDLGQELAAKAGPVIEIGGPTRNGYALLRDEKLPAKPFNIDVVGSDTTKHGSDSLRPGDNETLSALGDVRALPVKDESLNVIMAASLPGSDQHEVIAINLNESLDGAQKLAAIQESEKRQYRQAMDAVRAGDVADLIKQTRSPRIAAVLEASRTLKPGGLFIADGLNPLDMTIAKAAGMELVEHTPFTRAVNGNLTRAQGAVLRKL